MSRRINPFDRVEEIFMEASPETFAELEERIATIKRLRRLDRRPRRKGPASTDKRPPASQTAEPEQMLGFPIGTMENPGGTR